jgi:hypothetical protein
MAAAKGPIAVTPVLFKIGTPAFYALDGRAPQH